MSTVLRTEIARAAVVSASLPCAAIFVATGAATNTVMHSCRCTRAWQTVHKISAEMASQQSEIVGLKGLTPISRYLTVDAMRGEQANANR